MLFFPQEVQCFYKIRTCHSNFTVSNFSGVLHALLTKNAVAPKHLKMEKKNYQNSDKFGYSFVKNDVKFVYLLCIY